MLIVFSHHVLSTELWGCMCNKSCQVALYTNGLRLSPKSSQNGGVIDGNICDLYSYTIWLICNSVTCLNVSFVLHS